MSNLSHSETCRVCGEPLSVVFADLGMAPLAQSYLPRSGIHNGEMFYPLRATVCTRCWYVGLPEYVAPEQIFTEYAYLSSTSASWSAYIERSAKSLMREFGLGAGSQVVEMASNDGYFLKHFVAAGVQALGVEPAANVAQSAIENCVPTLADFFCLRTARSLREQGWQADLLLAYNCLDHVPDINDVIQGFRLLLKPTGVVQVELPYLVAMVEHGEFDTMYHDRFSYLSLHGLANLFAMGGLRIFSAERLDTHGGSLRIRACHADSAELATDESVANLLALEVQAGVTTVEYYTRFMAKAAAVKRDLLEVLIRLRREGRSIVGYGVPAKGNILLNYCGIRSDLLDFLVDKSPYKAGKLSPGTRLEIREVEAVSQFRPDYLLILPWNIKSEIIEQMNFVRGWDGKFIVPIPRVEIV